MKPKHQLTCKCLLMGIICFTSSLVGSLINYPTFAIDPSISSVDFEVNINPILTLAVTQPETILVDGNNINTLQTADITATVGTNNLTGYTLTMSSTTTDLVNNVMLDDSHVIHTLDENVTAANFVTNRWGISYDNGANYQPFTTSHQFEPTTGPTNQDTTSLKAGVKSDIHTGAGLYSNTISFMAVANALPLTCNPSATTINEAKCMQDMNENVKNSMVAETQYQLADSRDEKLYYIAKLTDGNVWMTQNLDYDLVAGQTLTSDLTDLTATQGAVSYNSTSGLYEWTPVNTTQTTAGIVWDQTGQGDSSQDRSYDPEANSDITYVVGASTYNSLANCVARQSGKTEAEARIICTHGNVGNYYNWYAATAQSIRYGDTGYNTDGANANNSICPKGWQLPSYSGNKSYYAMLVTAGGLPIGPGTDMDTKVITSPYYIGRAGYYSCGSGAMDNRGGRGYYWESNVYSARDARRLSSYSTYLNPQNTAGKGNGFSVRCVAR